MKNLGILGLLLVLVFSACRQGVNEVIVQQEIPLPGIENYVPDTEMINGSLVGFITDENEEPVADATVRFNGQTLTTDAYGYFSVENKAMNALGALVQVEKEGYFKGSRRFFPKADATSQIKIQLLPKTFDASFSSADGGTVRTTDGAAIDFAPASIKTADGSAYTGTVHVATQWMNPALNQTLNQMPGNLQGVNTEVETVALATYGMIAVELEGDNGEALNIADGQTATLTMPVPTSMLANAPATIPLWSFHETLGLWIEESSATLQNGAYVGEVSHFSFWNCDIPFENVQLEMRLLDPNEEPLSNFLVILSSSGGGAPVSSGSGYTAPNGTVSGAVPANEVLAMEIFDACGGLIYTDDIGPFAVDTDLGAIIIASSFGDFTTVTGILQDCSGIPLNNAVVIASFQGVKAYHYPDNSNFSMTFHACSSTTEIEITSVNLANLEQSDPIAVTPFTQTDLGVISTCGNQLEDYISITIDGVTAIYDTPSVSFTASGDQTFIEATSLDGNDFISFGFRGIVPGDYGGDNFLEAVINQGLNWNYQGGELMATFTVTQVDSKLVGSFSGEIMMGGVLLPVSCIFDIKI